MADQQTPVPPEMLAALSGQSAGAPAAAAPAPAAAPPPMAAVDHQAVCDSLMRAVQMCAEKGPAANDARETGEYAKSAFAFAQAYVQLHPGLIAPQGVPPEVMAASIPQQAENGPETAAEGGQETTTDKAAEGNG